MIQTGSVDCGLRSHVGRKPFQTSTYTSIVASATLSHGRTHHAPPPPNHLPTYPHPPTHPLTHPLPHTTMPPYRYPPPRPPQRPTQPPTRRPTHSPTETPTHQPNRPPPEWNHLSRRFSHQRPGGDADNAELDMEATSGTPLPTRKRWPCWRCSGSYPDNKLVNIYIYIYLLR